MLDEADARRILTASPGGTTGGDHWDVLVNVV